LLGKARDLDNMNRSSVTAKGRGKRNSSSRAVGRAKLAGAAASLSSGFRVGIGNDLHRLAPGRKLILGGIEIPFDQGPVGHSDGDVLAHAICDCLLGAAHLGDIGRHFPNSATEWKNASSLRFLRRVRELLDAAGFSIINIDATIGLERPKLAPHIPAMEEKVAEALGLRPGQVSVKAKSGEGLDAVGKGEAIRADAVALIQARS